MSTYEKDIDILEWIQWRASKPGRIKHTSYKDRLRPGNREEKGHLIAAYSWRTGGYRGDRAILLEVHTNMMRGNGHRLEHEKFWFNIQMGFI